MANASYYTGLSDWLLKRAGKDGYLILMYHRIMHRKKNSYYIQPGMYVEPETFRMHLGMLSQRFRIVKLSKLKDPDWLKQNINKDKPLCFLTFDDGWRDFYDYAFPLLREYSMPATVFLPTDLIGTERQFWTDQVIELLSNLNAMKLKNVEASSRLLDLLNKDDPHEELYESVIAKLKNQGPDRINEFIEELSDFVGKKNFITKERFFLDWNEVRSLRASGLVEFGSHTASHNILTRMEFPAIEGELLKSKEVLMREGAVSKDWIPFCYPNGNFTNQIANYVKTSGYHLAVTTKNCWNSSEEVQYTLNRIGLHQDIAYTESLLALRIINKPWIG
jgi:peptidoglycan/xylan/chitin deacetylase (PgdA/CDA1 family)